MLQALHVWPETRGAWTSERETRWLQVQDALAREPDSSAWTRTRELHDRLRFARLVAHLRGREPDANVGHSIMIYRLDDAELRAALHGPLPELGADPASQSR